MKEKKLYLHEEQLTPFHSQIYIPGYNHLL